MFLSKLNFMAVYSYTLLGNMVELAKIEMNKRHNIILSVHALALPSVFTRAIRRVLEYHEVQRVSSDPSRLR